MGLRGPKPEVMMRLDEYGIDAVCEDIVSQKTMTAIAKEQGVSIGSLFTWINANPEHSARAREARAHTARIWDEKAEEVLENSPDEFSLKKAKELAHHYRWRSAKINPRDYGDKVTQEHVGPNGGPVQMVGLDATQLSKDTLEELLRVRAAATNGS